MIINTKIISHPLNWLTIVLMLVIAGIFGHLLLSLLDQEPAGKGGAQGLPEGLAPGDAIAATAY